MSVLGFNRKKTPVKYNNRPCVADTPPNNLKYKAVLKNPFNNHSVPDTPGTVKKPQVSDFLTDFHRIVLHEKKVLVEGAEAT